MGKEYLKGIAAAIGGVSAIIFFGDGVTNKKYIPKTEKVQEGYIAPSRLEIECKDLDGNGKPETIMRIDDKSYLLREVNGEPVISRINLPKIIHQYSVPKLE